LKIVVVVAFKVLYNIVSPALMRDWRDKMLRYYKLQRDLQNEKNPHTAALSRIRWLYKDFSLEEHYLFLQLRLSMGRCPIKTHEKR